MAKRLSVTVHFYSDPRYSDIMIKANYEALEELSKIIDTLRFGVSGQMVEKKFGDGVNLKIVRISSGYGKPSNSG